MDKGTCSSSSGAPGALPEASQETKNRSSPTSTSSSLNSRTFTHSSPHRSSFTTTVASTHSGNTSPTLLKESSSQSDLGASCPVTKSSSGTPVPGLSTSKSVPQKPARTLLLPLIGKLPAIQRKARRKRWLLGKGKEKEGEEEEEAKGIGLDTGAQVNNQTCTRDIVESNPCSDLRTDNKQADGETAPPVSFTAEEMDKYRLLQEQAREHMQKVLEQTQESADIHTETKYTHTTHTNNCGTLEEQYTPLHNPSQPQNQALHTDSMQTQAQLQLSLPLPHVTQQENYTQPIALGVPNLPPLPPSSPLSNLHHIILQHTALSMPPSSSSSSTSSSSPTPALHPGQLPHPLHPLHPSLHHHLHLSPISISSIFPSILLSHHPIPLLPPSPAFHTTPLSPVTLQPLNPQPFMDRPWSVRFQQKAL